MKKRFHQITPATPFIIILLWCSSFIWFTSCTSPQQPEYNDQLSAWIDSLDRNSRKVGVSKSIKTLDSLMGTLEDPTFTDRLQYYKFMKVLSHRDSLRAADALIYTDSLLQLFSSVSIREKYPIDYSKALLLKGDDLFKQKEYYKAYRNYYHGKSFLTGLGELCECARYSSRIANISYKEGNYYQAIKYWKQELEELAACDDKDNFQLQFVEKQGSMRNIGSAHLQRNEPDTALVYFKQAEDFITNHGAEFPREQNFIKFAQLVIQQNKAKAYALKGETEVAEKLLQGCLQHDDQIDWTVGAEQAARLALTELYINTRQYSKAQQQLLAWKNMSAGTDDPATDKIRRKLQASVSFGLGRFEEASKLFIASQEEDRADTFRKNAENKTDVGQLLQQVQHEHEKELNAEKDARKDLILRFFVLILIALCIIAYLIWRNAKKAAKNLHAVTELNRTITLSNTVLQDTVNALEQAEMENEAVLKIVAHDLRNPIASMMSASELLFWDSVRTDDQEMIITGVQEAGRKANALISQILQSSPDRRRISKSEAALQDIVQSCIDMLSYKAAEKHQVIEYKFEQVTVPVDREKIWRVFCNLLSNAIKFSPAQSMIWVDLQVQSDKVLLSVKDSGIGIPENLKDQVFIHLSSAKRPGTAGEQSHGMGLAICKQIVEAHGGRIWFESGNSGTTFFVELPL